MGITLRQLEAFIQVARQKSFTRAAGELHLTQSATSALVKELESQLGLLLLDRTTRSVELTLAGAEFRTRAVRILGDVAHAVAESRDLLAVRRGQVSIAASPLASTTFLPGAIAAFIAIHPYIDVELHDVLTEDIVEQVRNGTAEIGVGTFEESVSEVTLVTLFEDRLGVVLPAKGILSRKRRLTWRDIATEPRIDLTSTSAFRPLVDGVYTSLRMVPAKARFEVGSMGTAVALAEAGLGISILPERAAALIRNDAVRWRTLHDPAVTRASTLVTRAGRSLSPGAQAFVDLLSRTVKTRNAPVGASRPVTVGR